jgi:hypothetical protein
MMMMMNNTVVVEFNVVNNKKGLFDRLDEGSC